MSSSEDPQGDIDAVEIGLSSVERFLFLAVSILLLALLAVILLFAIVAILTLSVRVVRATKRWITGN